MNEYKIRVYFDGQYIISDKIQLVKNDYKSTKFIFIFEDKYKDYTKTVEIKYPSGKKLFLEIENDEVILDNILVESGEYGYEIVLYDDDSKLTNFATGKFEVRDELAKSDDEEIQLETEYPILDQLIQNARTVKEECEKAGDYAKDTADKLLKDKKNGVFNGEKGDPFTYSDFTDEQLESLKGEKGDDGAIQYTAGNNVEITDDNIINVNLNGYVKEEYINKLIGNINTELSKLTTVGDE